MPQIIHTSNNVTILVPSTIVAELNNNRQGPEVTVRENSVNVGGQGIPGPAGRDGVDGLNGAVGPVGPTGPTGPAGAGDKNYRYQQLISASVWTVVHGLNKYPVIAVVDSAGSIVIGDVEYLDLNTVRLTFAGAFSGEAYFN